MFSRKGCEPLDVGWHGGRGWQGGACRRPPEGAQEGVETRWLGEKKEACFIGCDGERVRDVGRPLHEGTSRCLDQLAARPYRQLTIEHVKGLGLSPVYMQW